LANAVSSRPVKRLRFFFFLQTTPDFFSGGGELSENFGGLVVPAPVRTTSRDILSDNGSAETGQLALTEQCYEQSCSL
jgi:hypothetical protein